MEPHKILFLVEKPGVYRIEFDNTYSWYNEKIVRYRGCVLEPDVDEISIRKFLEIFKKNVAEAKP